MSRSASSFNRRGAIFKPQPTVLVICEDSKSSKDYLSDAVVHFRADVKVRVTHCGKNDPVGIVSEAIRQKRCFDKVFCVIDRDGHQTFSEALSLANTKAGVEVIASYPCFEFWLLLHFGFNTRPYAPAGVKSAADRVIDDLCASPGMAGYKKGGVRGLFDAMLGDRFDTARRVSPAVLAAVQATATMNPSTTLHNLMDFLEELSIPQAL